MKSGSLNFLEPSGPLQGYNGIDLPFIVHVRYFPFGLYFFNPFNAELNPICHLLALLGTHPILHVSRIRVNFVFRPDFTDRSALANYPERTHPGESDSGPPTQEFTCKSITIFTGPCSEKILPIPVSSSTSSGSILIIFYQACPRLHHRY